MACYVVAEGIADTGLLEVLLRPELTSQGYDVVLAAGGGWSAAESYARSLLVTRHDPVALVLDADATDRRRIAEMRRFLEESLGQVAPKELWGVFIAVPTLDSLLLQIDEIRDDVARELQVSSVVGPYTNPLAILESYRKSKGLSKVALIDWCGKRYDLSPLRDVEPIAALREFVGVVTQRIPVQA